MTLLRMMLHKLKKVNWIKKELDSNVKKLDRRFKNSEKSDLINSNALYFPNLLWCFQFFKIICRASVIYIFYP